MRKSKIEFGSLLTYTPRPINKKQIDSKEVMLSLKNDRLVSGISKSEEVVKMIKKNLEAYPFFNYFDKDTILIPIPKSSLLQKHELWVPQRITLSLEKYGLGKNENCLFRETALLKSSTALPNNRPKAHQHYDSMKVKELLFKPKKIILVDDVITRGATALGAVNKLGESFPDANIRVFAVMRTISNQSEFSNIVDPCTGYVSLSRVDTFRVP